MITLVHDLKYKELGRLYYNGQLIAFTLDPRILDKGLYDVVLNYSPRFKCNLPLVYNNDFTADRGFRIHVGNTLKDSNGCILVGNKFSIDLKGNITLSNSKNTLNEILKLQFDKLVII